MTIDGSTTGAWIFAICTCLLMGVAAAGTIRSGQMLRHWTPPGNLLLGVPDTLVRLAGIGLCVLLGLTVGPGAQQLGWGLSYLRADVRAGIVAGLVLAVLSAGAQWAVTRRWGEPAYSTRVLRCILPAGAREWALVMLALWPAAALEELLFRSLPLGGLGWIMSPWLLMWPLALFFGLLHWPQGTWGVAGAAMIAILLSWLFLATGSIWPPLIAHYTFNLSQLVVARCSGLEPLRAT